MIVEEVMVKDLITIGRDQSLHEAQRLMVNHSIRHLPVVEDGTLLGIITESDIRGAFIDPNPDEPGQATPLEPHNMPISSYMTETPLTVSPETNIEDAALMIYTNKIGAVPVVRGERVVGILSIMDILGLFVDMMGLIHSSSRIDVEMENHPDNIDAVSEIIQNHDINIISVGMSPHPTKKDHQLYLFRLDLCDTAPLVEAIEKAGYRVESAIH